MNLEIEKKRFLEQLKLVKRNGMDSLIEWLESTDFFTAPASTKYHGAYEGGLLVHSNNVFEWLVSEMEVCSDSVILVSLLHDVCKANYYKVSTRNVKNPDTGAWEQVPFYTVEDSFPYGHGEKSVYLISKHITLTDEEAMAIRWHMGGFDEAVRGGSYALSGAFEQYKLAFHLHIADMKATYLDECK